MPDNRKTAQRVCRAWNDQRFSFVGSLGVRGVLELQSLYRHFLRRREEKETAPGRAPRWVER
jgi:hypothetical protein